MPNLPGAYCSIEDVRERTLQELRASSTPSLESAEQWIINGANYINACLHEFNPPFHNKEALGVLLLINTDYAASRVQGATGNRDEALRLEERWRSDLQAIADGKISIGVSRRATFRGGDQIPLPAEETTTPPAPEADGDVLGFSDSQEELGL